MRWIPRGNKSVTVKWKGFAEARLRDMKVIMNALGLDYMRKPYRLPDADLVVESRYGLDSAWIVGKGIEINSEFLLDSPFNIIVSFFPPVINLPLELTFLGTWFRVKSATGSYNPPDVTNQTVYDEFVAASWSSWSSIPLLPNAFAKYFGGHDEPPARVTYSAKELKKQWSIENLGSHVLEIRVRHQQSVGQRIGRSMVYVEANPTSEGFLSAFFNVSIPPMITITQADIDASGDGTITIIWQDGDGYPFRPGADQEGGWQGKVNDVNALQLLDV